MAPDRRLLATAGVVAGLVALGLALTPDRTLSALQAALVSPWFPLVLVGLYLVRPLLAWPITALSLLVGYRYGLLLGLPLALVGAVATSLIPYAVGRYVAGHPSSPFAAAVDGSERFFRATGGLRGVVAVRLAPTPAEPVSLAAGAGRVPVRTFALGTALGELPWTVAAVVAGHSLSRFTPTVAPIDRWLLLAGLVGAAVLLAGPAYRWVRRERGPLEEPAG